MRLCFGFGFGFGLSALAVTLTGSPSLSASAQTGNGRAPQISVALHPELLPTTGFGSWKASTTVPAASEPAFSLVNANKEALEECNPQRSAVESYMDGQGRMLHVEAAEFKDASGALAAFSILSQPGMHEVKDLATQAKEGDGGVLLLSGATVAVAFPASLAEVPAKLADIATLKALVAVLPKPVGSQALLPLLPTSLSTRGLVPGSVRYAMGQRSYMAEGGVLPAAGLGWEKDAEAITAKYSDRRGTETLTLLLYPTPTIAGPHLRSVESQIAGLGPSFKVAKTRREGSLVAVANGTFSPDAAQALVENTHLHQFASTDKAMPPDVTVEVRKTVSLLTSIIIFSGVLGLAAVLLGVFLGGGRALIRVLRGQPAATEAEFLSLHLEPQNPMPVFSKE